MKYFDLRSFKQQNFSETSTFVKSCNKRTSIFSRHYSKFQLSSEPGTLLVETQLKLPLTIMYFNQTWLCNVRIVNHSNPRCNKHAKSSHSKEKYFLRGEWHRTKTRTSSLQPHSTNHSLRALNIYLCIQVLAHKPPSTTYLTWPSRFWTFFSIQTKIQYLEGSVQGTRYMHAVFLTCTMGLNESDLEVLHRAEFQAINQSSYASSFTHTR